MISHNIALILNYIALILIFEGGFLYPLFCYSAQWICNIFVHNDEFYSVY